MALVDAESKLIPTFLVGKRDGQTALAYMEIPRRRLAENGRIQLTTEGSTPTLGPSKGPSAMKWIARSSSRSYGAEPADDGS